MSNSTPGLTYGQVPTAGQWNGYLAAKQDYNPILDAIIAQNGAAAVSAISTWTPADASGASLAFTGVTTRWQSIGNMVFLSAYLVFPTTSNTAQANLSGLPIPVPNLAFLRFPSAAASSYSSPVFVFPTLNSNNVVLASQIGAAITNANMSGQSLCFQISYPLS